MTNKKRNTTKLSSFMSKILRHSPSQFGVTMNEYGYCKIDELVAAIKVDKYWQEVTEEDVFEVVRSCTKQRYEISGDKVRARYGHSIPVVQHETSKEVPPYLIHGTNDKALEYIWNQKEGLKKMGRQFVHLSETEGFATLSAKRRGEPVLLLVDTEKLKALDVPLYYAGNEVWLADNVPIECLIRKK